MKNLLEYTGITIGLQALRSKFATHRGFRQILSNIGWLLFDKALRVVVGLFVVAWVARHLGPDRFGMLNYVIAFVGLFMTLHKLGLDGIVVRDIVRSPDDAEELLGTAFAMKLAGGLLMVALSVPIITIFRPDDPLVWTMALVVALGFVFRSFESIELWFRSQVRSKSAVIAQSVAYLINSLFKIFLILAGAGVFFFAAATFLEAILVAAGLVLAYRLTGRRMSRWRPRLDRGKTLLLESWPLIFSGFFVLIYLQVDQIMLGQMMDDHAVGLYSAVVRISAFCYYIPMVITWSVQPSIVSAREKDEKLYYSRLQDLFSLLTIGAYGIAIPVALFSNEIIELVFGAQYLNAAPVLVVHIFAAVFVFVGVARGLWVVTESFMTFNLFANVLAAFVNIALNLLFIDRYGILGAAYATLISYFIAYIGSSFLFAKTRKVFFMQMRSLLLLDTFRLLRRTPVKGSFEQ